MTTRPAAIEARHITAGYGDLMAIRDIDVTVHHGEVVALFGPNGAGKSTTLQTMAGSMNAAQGEVLINGSPNVAPLHVRARGGLAMVPEGRSVVNALSVRDNLRLGPGSVEAALEIFPQLGRLLKRQAGLLSGGEQQMLALGRALAGDPQVLLVDELSLGLAPVAVEQLLSALRGAVTRRGVAVLIVEQRARQAFRIVDRWYLLRNGRVRAEGDAQGGLEALESAYLAST